MGNVLAACKQNAESDAVTATPRGATNGATNGVETKKPTNGAPNTAATLNTQNSSSNQNVVDSDDELYSEFFDACENEADVMMYPPANIADPHPRQSIVMTHPDSLLKERKPMMRRATLSVKKLLLNEPRVTGQLRGYPGELTKEEMEACLEFRKMLKLPHHTEYQHMVDCFSPQEEEPYALCRFMRARNFTPESIFSDQGLQESMPYWNEAQAHDFYANPQTAVGCPTPVFLTQFPYIYYGHAKNGCPVGYIMAGNIEMEGIQCVTALENINKYMWYSIMHNFKNIVARSQKENPDLVVRCEAITVIDLKGLGSSQLNQQTLDVLKNLVVVTRVFPELLNRLVITNAPMFFSMAWPVIKGFLDPRTVAKIEIYSKSSKAQKRLKEMISTQELLADFGGTAPSFEQVVSKESKEARQEVHLMSIAHGKEQKWDFSVGQKESATVTVYTKSSAGGTATLKSNNKAVATKEIVAKTPEESYSTEIASNLQPNKYHIAIKSKSECDTTHFLVHVQVFQK